MKFLAGGALALPDCIVFGAEAINKLEGAGPLQKQGLLAREAHATGPHSAALKRALLRAYSSSGVPEEPAGRMAFHLSLPPRDPSDLSALASPLSQSSTNSTDSELFRLLEKTN